MKQDNQAILREIEELKRERDAIIIAHNYQNPEIQDIADFTGDSLALSRLAADSPAQTIVFCGVHFMAETAAILSPEKTVLLPAPDAGCPMADMVDVPELLTKKAEFPQATVVCYVNSSAAVKAHSDICVTSANALAIVNSLESQEILFIPDQNLGHWVAQQTTKTVHLWEGYCITHHRVSPQAVQQARNAHPDAEVLIHPECQPEVVHLADQVLSTDGMLRYARSSPSQKFVIGTEMGLIHRLKKENPQKTFFLLHPGLICPNMKKTARLSQVRDALLHMEPVIQVPAEIRVRARRALDGMLAMG